MLDTLLQLVTSEDYKISSTAGLPHILQKLFFNDFENSYSVMTRSLAGFKILFQMKTPWFTKHIYLIQLLQMVHDSGLFGGYCIDEFPYSS